MILIISSCVSAQPEIAIEQENNENLVAIINSIQLLKEFNGNEIAIRIFEHRGIAGSAGFDSGEVNSNLYIAVSEYDELPEQSLFYVKSFYNPKIIEVSEKGDYVRIELEYGMENARKSISLSVSINELEIEKNASS